MIAALVIGWVLVVVLAVWNLRLGLRLVACRRRAAVLIADARAEAEGHLIVVRKRPS